ncbi:MAG: XamI family restriction endonuclease [Sphingomonadaceae bacterium]
MQQPDAQKAEALYVASLASGAADTDWSNAVVASRKRVLNALRASDHLRDIETALKAAGEHLTVFRHMFGPPLSQDQFALICPAYRKSCEKTRKRVGGKAVSEVSAAISLLLDPKITPWLRQSRRPRAREIRHLVATVAPMLSLQVVATLRRNRLSLAQETAVIDLLTAIGWTRLSSGLVNQSAALPARHFMHKTRFATQTRPQEVDIALGLGTSVVLAMECKVTNDRTNSVKRVNDILKKATAWQLHWGSFVRTAALLQGVIAEKDVQRLLAANVEVFWSHDLARFRAWLAEYSAASPPSGS